MASLSDQLKKLGVEIGTQNLIPKKRKQSQHPIHTVIVGEELLTKFGSVYRVSENVPLGERYGNAGLVFDTLPPILLNYFASDPTRKLTLEELVFIDTETTGLGLGSGIFAFLIGIGRFTNEHFVIEQYFLRDPSEEPAVLSVLAEQIPKRPVVVSFNGKAFDLPLLTNRFVLNSITSPFHSADHLDLLHLARRLWRERLASRTLINLEGQILAAQRTQEDVPGWVIPQLYNDYLNTGDARLIKNVFYHNAKDVLAMAALLNHVSELLSKPLDEAQVPIEDIISIGFLYQSLGDIPRANAIFRYVIEQDPPVDLYQNVSLCLALNLKRSGAWSEAIQHWKQSASCGQIDACIELAKYYEHQEKNFHEALFWAETGLGLVSTPADTIEWQAALDHRRNRLQRKIKRSDEDQS